ncbi:hypothetical protein HMPREF1478_00076 [Actinomyces sp. HPA0247]|uniref:hypothetical protein n=1 Tax=Actinomyces sp. HPA0247 TaxID=1203556 RepID=UPI00034E3500|nr:hypothetical protein [Actinomyces sp. HPA0247]EPD74125.1 hypothetical protein HMPREF1478_00076 [Actinomyces sp. HPA0247]
MKMHVYGPGGRDCPTVLIIHPMLSSASSMKAALCDHMGPGLRFLVPDLSAHGDEASTPYVSAAAEAAAHAMVASFSAMSEESIRAIVRDCSHVSLPPLSPAIQRHCTFAYGQKDSDLRLARRVIPRLYPETELRVWPGWGHCERMSRDARAYGAMLRDLVTEGR